MDVARKDVKKKKVIRLIAGLAPHFAMLTAVACLVAAVGGGSLLLFGIARSLGHDLYSRAIAPRSPTSPMRSSRSSAICSHWAPGSPILPKRYRRA